MRLGVVGGGDLRSAFCALILHSCRMSVVGCEDGRVGWKRLGTLQLGMLQLGMLQLGMLRLGMLRLESEERRC